MPLLFLHGVAGSAWSWAPQIGALGAQHPTYAWEARGHGRACPVRDAGLSDYFDDAREALAFVTGSGRRAVVAGHSMGGLLGLALAAEFPSRVAGLFLVEPVYAPDGGTHAAGLPPALMRALLGPLVRSLERDGRIARTLARAIFVRAFEDRERMERAWRLQRAQVPLEYPRMMYEAFEGTTGFPNRAFAEEIDVPVTLLEGSVALRGPRFPKLNAALRRRLGERFRYNVIKGGHYLQLDRDAAVTQALENLVTCLR